MTAARIATTTKPDGAPRVASLDILRGLAILGILFMNINDMGQSMTASFGDVRHLGWTVADQWAWWLREVFANGTARGLLQMLFGVGMVILTDRAAGIAEGKWAVLRGYWWRNIVLFAFGVIHMYILLWPGDILHTYALAALLAVFFRRLSWKWLLPIGLIFAMLQLFGGGIGGYYMGMRQQAEIAALRADRTAGKPLTVAQQKTLTKAAEADSKRAKNKVQSAKEIADEDAGRLGTPMTWVKAQTEMSLSRFPTPGEIFSVWESLATMLIGAALFKLGFLQGSRSLRFYIGFTALAYAVAIPLRAYAAWEQMQFTDGPHVYWATNEIARLAMTVGHVGLVHVLLGTMLGTKLLRPFEAAGRTALTVYIAQTMICLWVLYPPFGFHLYRQQDWMELMLTALAINAALLWGANVWLRHYAIAPVEWAWRSIVERRRLPFRKSAPQSLMGGRTIPVQSIVAVPQGSARV